MIEVRIAVPSDAWAIRELRMEALTKDGRYFTASYEEESRLPLGAWREACTETTDHALFCAVDGDAIVGMMKAIRQDHDTVKWGSAYIQPNYRRSGVGDRLYKLREDWSTAQSFQRAVFTIRDDNKRSQDIHQNNGAQKFGEKPMKFADGSVALAVWFEKRLVA